MQEPQTLRLEPRGELIDTGDVAAGPVEAGDRPSLTGSSPTEKTIGIVGVAPFAARGRARWSQRAQSPGGAPNPIRTQETDQTCLPQSGIRLPHSGLRQSLILSSPPGTRQPAGAVLPGAPASDPITGIGLLCARARAATRQPHRREA